MNKRLKGLVAFLIAADIVAVLVFLASRGTFAVLEPKGIIAEQQKDLLIFATLLIGIIVVPVLLMTFGIVWKYRASNSKAKYTPDWDSDTRLETIWWGLPIAIILVLSVAIWQSSHQLDPFKPIASTKQPITIQVVAMQWKWLFIYPEQGIATVNFVQFPKDTPVKFEITADAPMNSFWIPQLAGQIYAMNGMSTQLHVMANEPGDFRGSSANLSGEGFAGMKFIARSSSQVEFDSWVTSVKANDNDLGLNDYTKLAVPTKNAPAAKFSSVENQLFAKVISKYLPADGSGHNGNTGKMHNAASR